MHHANADMRLADFDIARLLSRKLLRDSFLRVGLQFRHGDVVTRAHGAGRLWIGRIDLSLGDDDCSHECRETKRRQYLSHCCSYTELRRVCILHVECCITVIASSCPTSAGSVPRSSTCQPQESARTSARDP